MRKNLLTFVSLLSFSILILLHSIVIDLYPTLKFLGASANFGKRTIAEFITPDLNNPRSMTSSMITALIDRLRLLEYLTSPFTRLTAFLRESSTVLQATHLLNEKGRTSHWVVLFLNDAELRPGGGFIGSLGFISIQNFQLKQFEVRDVYELDGQITSHNQPHFAVAQYLHKPTEFIRDSNFDPYFSVNAEKILGYLHQIPETNGAYDGVIGITATGFGSILRLIGPVTLPDFALTVTADTFSQILDRSIETRFFPGSTHKQNLLGSFARESLSKISSANPLSLVVIARQLATENNFAVYSTNTTIQSFCRRYHCAGTALSTDANWMLPVDANVGVNKVNPLIKKSQTIRITTNADSVSYHATVTNTSNDQNYKDFIQLYLPPRAQIATVRVNGVKIVDAFQTVTNTYQSVGTYVEVHPGKTLDFTVDYHNYDIGRPLTVQKQMGSGQIPTTVIWSGSKSKIDQFMHSREIVITSP